ncbi:MAG: hypothetical protein JNG86_04870 [Verrucomicrobiaceae bacterium]|nr:hypothetical protein [Verrucomicrobiaceae bacterium]
MPRVLLLLAFSLGTGALLGLAACSTSASRPAVAVMPADVQLARHFLDSLYRPKQSSHDVIVDAGCEKALSHLPLAKRNRDLRARLDRLREAPAVIQVVLQSGDQPPPWGSSLWRYVYDRETGAFTEAGAFDPAQRSHDMAMDIRHWPNGTRLVSLNVRWLPDLDNDTFHLKRSETTFRFAISIIPCLD